MAKTVGGEGDEVLVGVNTTKSFTVEGATDLGREDLRVGDWERVDEGRGVDGDVFLFVEGRSGRGVWERTRGRYTRGKGG